MNLNLTREEQEIFDLKYKSKPIGTMSESEVSKWGKALLVKIHVITGWVIPASEVKGKESELMNILVDQFQKKLKESYYNVNPDEVEFAFRTYGTTVKDWGKNMNLSLIDEVMIPYLEARKEISKMEEQKKLPQQEKAEAMSEETMQDWFKETAALVVAEKTKVEFMPLLIAEWLQKKELLTNPKIYEVEAAVHIGKELGNKALQGEGTKEYAQYREMFKSGCFEGKYIQQIEDLSKKMAVWDYILKSKDNQPS